MELKVSSYFSPLVRNNPEDAESIAAALNALGYWKPDPRKGLIPFDPDREFFSAIRKFQTEHRLFHDGVLRPGGPTEQAINDALEANEKSGRIYLWRTVRDGHVRPEHAWREGRMFRWSEKLPGGHPGEDYNCRCWAEPYSVDYKTERMHKEQDAWKKKQAEATKQNICARLGIALNNAKLQKNSDIQNVLKYDQEAKILASQLDQAFEKIREKLRETSWDTSTALVPDPAHGKIPVLEPFLEFGKGTAAIIIAYKEYRNLWDKLKEAIQNQKNYETEMQRKEKEIKTILTQMENSGCVF